MPYFVMGTGSRNMLVHPDARTIYRNLEKYCLALREQHPDLILISGMAEGWDEAIAKVAYRNSIPYHVHIPNPGYGRYYWEQHSLLAENRIDMFNELVAGASKVIIVSRTIYLPDGTHANFARNQSMVDACDFALVYESESPGTRDAIKRLRIASKTYKCYPF